MGSPSERIRCHTNGGSIIGHNTKRADFFVGLSCSTGSKERETVTGTLRTSTFVTFAQVLLLSSSSNICGTKATYVDIHPYSSTKII